MKNSNHPKLPFPVTPKICSTYNQKHKMVTSQEMKEISPHDFFFFQNKCSNDINFTNTPHFHLEIQYYPWKACVLQNIEFVSNVCVSTLELLIENWSKRKKLSALSLGQENSQIGKLQINKNGVFSRRNVKWKLENNYK